MWALLRLMKFKSWQLRRITAVLVFRTCSGRSWSAKAVFSVLTVSTLVKMSDPRSFTNPLVNHLSSVDSRVVLCEERLFVAEPSPPEWL